MPIEALSEAERADALDALPDWDYDEGRDAIRRSIASSRRSVSRCRTCGYRRRSRTGSHSSRSATAHNKSPKPPNSSSGKRLCGWLASVPRCAHALCSGNQPIANTGTA